MIILSGCTKKNRTFFVINGEIENFTGTLYISNILDSKYYNNCIIKDSVFVKDGRFEFKISNKNQIAIPYRFYIGDNYRTKSFILEPIDQFVKINENEIEFHFPNNNIPKSQKEFKFLDSINSKYMNEFRKKSDSIFKLNPDENDIQGLMDEERSKLVLHLDSILLNFTKSNQNSVFAFWEISSRLTGGGYSTLLENSFYNLSDSLKNCNSAKLLKIDFENAKHFAVGTKFPELILQDINLNTFDFKISDFNNTAFILIDFWNSNCAPCVKEFPKINNLYENYNEEKLNIITISVDQSKEINKWKDNLKKHNIKGIYLLDENGQETSKRGINKFPTNFLINNQGVIIAKDISIDEIKKFLNK